VPRITPVDPSTTEGRSAELFDGVRQAFGTVPNGVATIGASTPALEGFMAVNLALAGGALRPAEREQIAIAVAEFNGCTYCLSAHTAAADAAGVSEQDRSDARQFRASGARPQAILGLVEALLEQRGGIDDGQFAAAREGDLTDAEIVEVAAQVSLSTFTNFVNRAAQTELDFPQVEAGAAA